MHQKISSFWIIAGLIILLVSPSCVTHTSHVLHDDKRQPDKNVAEDGTHEAKPEEHVSSLDNPEGSEIADKENPNEIAAVPEQKDTLQTEDSPEDSSQPSDEKTPKSQTQELLDSALAFCQTSSDFWEQGDLENSIDALDEAYSLILKVNPSEADPEILQQKEDIRFTISKRIIEVYSSRFTVANGNHTAIPLVINSHVERALKLFKTKERDFFIDSYRRSGRYRPAIVSALKEAGLPEDLSWLPLIESGFKTRALSRARALGMWQFIASTGYKFGLKRDTWVDERMDPEKSTAAAICYLKELHQIFGDWTTALAAYNCGEGTVLRRIRNQKINYLDNFWDLYQTLPLETAFYVPKFMAVLHILNDPEHHGFTLPPLDQEIETEKVTIEKQIHLKTMSKYLDIPYRVLEELNPELRHNSTPTGTYVFKVPKGKGPVLLSKLNEIPVWHPPVPEYVVHRVKKGESLSVIARRYRTSVRSIIALNGLRRAHYIKAGWKLKIPTRRTYASYQKDYSTTISAGGEEELSKYVVRKGDSLWRIARNFGTTTRAIEIKNNLKSSRLSIGQVLFIPRNVTALGKIKTKSYEVVKGDSPYLIAIKHKMDLVEFLRLNNLTPRSTIFPGQVLLVKAG